MKKISDDLLWKHRDAFGQDFRPAARLWLVHVVEYRTTRDGDGCEVSGSHDNVLRVASVAEDVGELQSELAGLLPFSSGVQFRLVSAQRLPESVFILSAP